MDSQKSQTKSGTFLLRAPSTGTGSGEAFAAGAAPVKSNIKIAKNKIVNAATRKKPLAALSVEEVAVLFRNSSLEYFVDQVSQKKINGRKLSTVESVDDLRSLGLDIPEEWLKVILKDVTEIWRKTGVPLEGIVPNLAPLDVNQEDSGTNRLKHFLPSDLSSSSLTPSLTQPVAANVSATIAGNSSAATAEGIVTSDPPKMAKENQKQAAPHTFLPDNSSSADSALELQPVSSDQQQQEVVTDESSPMAADEAVSISAPGSESLATVELLLKEATASVGTSTSVPYAELALEAVEKFVTTIAEQKAMGDRPGLLKCIVKLIALLIDSLSVSERGMNIIIRLCRLENEEKKELPCVSNIQRLGEAGACEVVANVLERHRDKVAVVELVRKGVCAMNHR